MSESLRTSAEQLRPWARPMPEMGPAVYRLTSGPDEHKHNYHVVCPWSPDGRLLLLARYDRREPEAGICVQDQEDGTIKEIGRSSFWNSHTVAYQQWQGNTGRILFEKEADGASVTAVSVQPDGSDAREFTSSEIENFFTCSPDGRYAYGCSPWRRLFPGDEIAGRRDKGLVRYDFQRQTLELVLSLEDAIALLPPPDREEAKSAHVQAKMMVPHRRTGRIMCNLANELYDRAGVEKRVRGLIAVNPDGSNAVYLGRPLHHPNWHPTEETVLVNVRDFNDRVRLGLYRGDGAGLLEYVPGVLGSGHPGFSPDGRWIGVDRSEESGSSIALCHPVEGSEITAAVFQPISTAHAAFRAIDQRGPGEKIIDIYERTRHSRGEKQRQTDMHPVWSRDGSVLLFNADLGDGSQLYAIDVERAVEAAQRK